MRRASQRNLPYRSRRVGNIADAMELPTTDQEVEWPSFMQTIVVDLDGTLTVEDSNLSYADRLPNLPMARKLREYQAQGFRISIYTARNMRTHHGAVGVITALTVPIIVEWLKRHDIPFDELHVGKPWAGDNGFYVDDRAVRPDEFLRLSHSEILSLISNGPVAE